MKNLLKSAVLVVAVLGCMSAQAQHSVRAKNTATKVVVVKGTAIRKGVWENLGTKTVDVKADIDQLVVNRFEGAFKKVKLHITKSTVHIKTMKIIFQNGDTQVIAINKNFGAGTTSASFDLTGNKRVIEKIIFNYKTIETRNGKAMVTVFGMN